MGMRASKILKLYLKNFIIQNYNKIFWLTNQKINGKFEIYLNLTHIKFTNKHLWQLIINYPNEILYEIKKNIIKLFFIVNHHNKYFKKSVNFSIFLVSQENFNILHQKNINLQYYKKLIISNLKIISQYTKKIKLSKLKVFCINCKKIINFTFDNNYQTINLTKISTAVHGTKQHINCTKNSIYFIKNSSVFIYEKFLQCQYILVNQNLSNKFMNLLGVINHNPLFSLTIGYCYELIGILDIYKENIVTSSTKKIFILIKILGLKLDLYKKPHNCIWYNLIAPFYAIIKTKTFLDKIKTLLFQNIAGFEILKLTISCLLFIGYYEHKRTLMHISEKIMIGLISYPEFYNLLINRISNFSYSNSSIKLKKNESISNHKIKKKIF